MANERLRGFLRRLHGVVGRDDETLSDAQLLVRFVNCRDEAAFEVLVWRHGGLVFGVGCRLLRQVADAEDVFQATFLTLARKAPSIARSEALSSWLYKVAYRLALRVRTLRAATHPLGNLDLPDNRSAIGQEAEHPILHVAKMGIQTAEIKKRPAIERVLQLHGSTALDPEQVYKVRCRFLPAVVVQIGQAEGQKDKQPLGPGDRVRKGQLLVVLASVEVSQKKNDLLDALVTLHQDELILDRAEKAGQATPEVFLLNARRNVESDRNAVTRAENALNHWGVPQKDIEAVRKEAAARTADPKPKPETAEEQKARLARWAQVELDASEDGVIVERNFSVGEMLADTTVNLFQLARMERLKVVAQVYEEDLSTLESLKPEQRRWTIRTDGADGPVGRGSFDKIGVVIYPPTRTATVTGFLDNAEGRFRPGQLVTASITFPSGPGDLVLPAAAVVEQGRQTFVFVQPDANKHFYERRRVVLLRRGHEVVHLRSRPSEEQPGARVSDRATG
jgi:cobalt-zinc-cadmium efflux system membrane fusion protein